MKQTNSKFVSSLGLIILIIAVAIYSWNVKENLNPHPQVIQSPKPDVQGATASGVLEVDAQEAKVTKVVDGDTIEVELEGAKYTVRFIGIDTPETVDPRRPVGCFGKEASNKTKELLENKTVLLMRDVSDTDRYNRLLRYILLPLENGNLLFVNDYLVREGYAVASTYPPDVKYTDKLMQAQQEAKASKKGLWEKC